MNVAVLLVVFALPIVWGLVVWGFTWWRDRIRLARAFAAGRSENVTRLPQVVEPMPTPSVLKVVAA